MFAKGSAIGQDVVNKVQAFDEKHRLIASALEKAISFYKKVGLTEKLTVGIFVVNEKGPKAGQVAGQIAVGLPISNWVTPVEIEGEY
ncbi:hypothetical protein ACFX13_007583 [Malus domestica]